MRDKEIIKALECCINDDCDNCPDTFGNCEHNAMRNALDLINRQKASIENLQKSMLQMANANIELIDKERDEAVKEFVKLVIKNIRKQVNPIPQQRYLVEMCIKVIRSLAKETEGGVNG